MIVHFWLQLRFVVLLIWGQHGDAFTVQPHLDNSIHPARLISSESTSTSASAQQTNTLDRRAEPPFQNKTSSYPSSLSGSRTKSSAQQNGASATISASAWNSTNSSSEPTSTSSWIAPSPTGYKKGGFGDTPSWNASKDLDCNSLVNMNVTDRWRVSEAEKAWYMFREFWDNDLRLCKECCALNQFECNSTKPDCRGIQETFVRFDRSLGAWAMNTTSFDCTPDSDGCGRVACSQHRFKGPAEWVLLESFTQGHQHLQFMMNGLRDERASTTNLLDVLKDLFDPEIDTIAEAEKARKMAIAFTVISAFLSIASILASAAVIPTTLGLIGADVTFAIGKAEPAFKDIVGAAKTGIDAGLNTGKLAIDITKGVTGGAFTKKLHQGGAHSLDFTFGALADEARMSLASLAHTMFVDGNVRHGNMSMTFLDLVEATGHFNNTYTEDSHSFEQESYDLLKMFMIQHLVKNAWDVHIEKDNKVGTTHIAFSDISCANLEGIKDTDPRLPLHHRNLMSIDSKVDYNGSRYWLLNAMVDLGGEKPDWKCGPATAPPGGTHENFRTKATAFTNLTLLDFVLPSVDTWIARGRKNAQPGLTYNTELLPNVRGSGMMDIPVCDYANDFERPGMRCPLYDKVIRAEDTGEKKCPVQGWDSEPNEVGSFMPGTCSIRVVQAQRQVQPDSNPYPEYELNATIWDQYGREIGNAGKSTRRVIEI